MFKSAATSFSRAYQMADEKLLKGEKLAHDEKIEARIARIDKIKKTVTSLISQTEAYLTITASYKVENKLLESISKKKDRIYPAGVLGNAMLVMSKDCDWGSELSPVFENAGNAYVNLGLERGKFIEKIVKELIEELRKLITDEITPAQRKVSDLENARLDLNAVKRKLRAAKTDEIKQKIEVEENDAQGIYDKLVKETNIQLEELEKSFEYIKVHLRNMIRDEAEFYEHSNEMLKNVLQTI